MSSTRAPSFTATLAAWAASVRDAYVILLPLTFFGVAATVLGHLPSPAWQQALDQVFGPRWQAVLDQVVSATYGLFGLALAVTLSTVFAPRLRGDRQPLLPAMWLAASGMVNFMLCVLAGDQPRLEDLGQGATLLGVAVGTATPLLLDLQRRVATPRLLRLDYETDPVFVHATRAALPLAVSGTLMLVLAHAGVLAGQLLSAWWTGFAQDIRQSGAHGSTLTLALVAANQLLWSVGIHGGKVLDHWLPDLYVPAGQPFDPALAWRPLIDNFVHLGGSGATLGLALALLLAVRAGPQRRLAQVSLLPSLLNINELLVFGLPVVLQPLYLLPFVGVPLLLAGLTLVAVHLGGLPLLPVNLPWTTPPLLSGWLLTGSAWGAALQLAGIGLSVLLYLPFVRRVEHARQQRQAQSLLDAHREILVDRNRHQPSLRRRDHVGDIARGLLEDLKADLRAPGGATALALVYQPQHDRQGRAVGVEALLRWTHPRFGAIRADVAVALAEQGGLIRELGLHVLDRACACKAGWNRRGLQAATMSVNVSPLQLDDPSFATLVAGTLGRHGLRPGELELEVTESHAVPMDLTLDRNMTQLAAMGVRVAMDDFGMGHSSLLHLRRFRVHAIKIDGSLTRDLLGNPACADIVRTITALGRAQRLDVVAEFVEIPAQRDALADLGCDLFQGYLFSPPLAADACAEHLLQHGRAAG